jgi:hypothetical protein
MNRSIWRDVASIPFKDFRMEMLKQFRNKPVHEPLMLALYNRFRPLKMASKGDTVEQ